MRTVVTGIVVLIIACVVAGGVVGWQMKAKYEPPPSSSDWKLDPPPSPSRGDVPPVITPLLSAPRLPVIERIQVLTGDLWV